MKTDDHLSQRGRQTRDYDCLMINYATKVLGNIYHPEKNPNGMLNLGVAENTLCEDLWLAKLRSIDLSKLEPEHQYYFNFSGTSSFKEAMARFLERKFKAARSINPDNLVVTSGVGAALDHLAHMLCDPGDYCLVHTPYYEVLSSDIGMRAGVNTLYAPLELKEVDGKSEFKIDINKTEEAIMSAINEGKKVMMSIVMNPNNPTGQVLTKQDIMELLTLYNKYKIHVVMDEIYALSMLGDTQFTSLLSLHDLPNPHMVHFVWGFSKDLSLSGFRCGIIHSLLPDFCVDSTRLLYLGAVTPLTQFVLTDVIQDEEWMEGTLFPENKHRMEASYEYLNTALIDFGALPQLPKAAFFIWADLSKLLATPTVQEEMRLFEAFIAAGVYCIPGTAMRCKEPGWFRFTFTHPKQYLDVGIGRLTEAIERFTSSGEILLEA